MLNKNGAVLPITVAAMAVIMIAGLACLKLFSAQTMLASYDVLKLRTYYAAEGAIERVRGILDSNNEDLTLESKEYGVYKDDSMFPPVWTRVSFTKKSDGQFFLPDGKSVVIDTITKPNIFGGYIVAHSTATLENNFASQVIASTMVYCYVCSTWSVTNPDIVRYFVYSEKQ